MKTIAIALKDLTRSFRSTFALVFMFGVPLLMTGMMYLMVGNTAGEQGDAQLPVTSVLVVNLDQGSQALDQGLVGATVTSLGELVVQTLESEAMTEMLDVRRMSDAAAARRAVDNQQAGVAIIIPENFSAAYAEPSGQAVLELYQDPTLAIGPQQVRAMLTPLMDTFSAVRITASVSMARGNSAAVGPAVQQYLLLGW